ncbi:9855_t:CDS:2, partial [Gigaspora margarita]
MDETPVWFNMASDLTVEQIGAKTVHIHTTGNKKNWFTVVLTCFADGQKLPPTVIFKGQRWAKTKGSPPPEINPEIIRGAFYKCSISNAIDGSEDNEIYYNKILDNKTDEAKENNSDMDSGDSDKSEEDFEDKENLDATIKENED